MADMMKLNGVFDKIRNAGALPKWYTAQPFTDIDRILKNNPALSPALRWSDALTPAVLLASQRSLTADLTAVLRARRHSPAGVPR